MKPRHRVRGWTAPPPLLLMALTLIGSTAALCSETTPFTPREKAFYADQATVNFVRPGLVFNILGATVATDGTVKVHFTMTDPKGLGLDRTGVVTPGTVSSSFILATIPNSSNYYQAYTTRTKTSTYAPTAGKKVKQASADSGGTYTKNADGDYTYTFATKLPASYDKTATLTIGLYGSRSLAEFDLGVNYASTEYSFVPSGAAVTKVRDVIATSNCNKCHTDLNFHGGSRRGVPMCILCHAPAYGDVQNTNPETDNTIDMTTMVHRIHSGATLPSVKAGKPYQIIGFGNAVSDFSDVTMPSDIRNCAFCHDSKATQADAWLTRPSRAACGSCHDNVNFATGENHANLPQVSDNQCKSCHVPEGELEFDASIKGAHTIPTMSSMLPKRIATITSVDNAGPGNAITVHFQLKDGNGAVVPLNTLNRLYVVLAGPTTDYVAMGSHGYVSEDVTKTSTLSGDTYAYTFTNKLPANASGTYTVGLEGRDVATLLPGTTKQQSVQFNISNVTYNFSVDGSAVAARRQIVSLDKCNGCHANLVLHGANRNKIEQCVLCHNPVENDGARRPAAKLPAESVNFALMIHRIHAGEEQTRDFTIYGYGGSANNFNDVVFPSTLNNCSACHVNGSENVPSKATATIADPRGYLNPVHAATGACLGCHTSLDAASHALVNTSTLGESCATCHGSGRDQDVSKVHAQ